MQHSNACQNDDFYYDYLNLPSENIFSRPLHHPAAGSGRVEKTQRTDGSTEARENASVQARRAIPYPNKSTCIQTHP